MADLPVKNPPEFTTEIPAVTEKDHITAELENYIKAALLNNDVYLREKIEEIIRDVITKKGGTIDGGNLDLKRNYYLRRQQGDGTSYDKILEWYHFDGSDDENPGVFLPQIGRYSRGNNSSVISEDQRGTIHIVPYQSDSFPWNAHTGLSIGKDLLRMDGNDIPYPKSYTEIDLTGAEYDRNTWYYVRTLSPIDANFFGTFAIISCFTNLSVSGQVEWSTHPSKAGVAAQLMLLVDRGNAGQNSGVGMALSHHFSFCSQNPIGYKQSASSSYPMLILRGGIKYFIKTSFQTKWKIFTEGETIGSSPVVYGPTQTTEPTIEFRKMNTIIANVEGIVSQAQNAMETKYAQILEIQNGNEVNFRYPPSRGHVWFNYREVGTNSLHGSPMITGYKFGDCNGDAATTFLEAGKVLIGARNHPSGEHSSAIGVDNNVGSAYSLAAGQGNTVNAYGSVALGANNEIYDPAAMSLAAGYALQVQEQYASALGYFNKPTGNGLFTIGNGGNSATRHNCFRIDYGGNVIASGTFNTATAADYAEFFEWLDGNLNNEDRTGYFVTLEGDKIRIADKEDYILGIISGKPAVLGNSDCDSWNGMYLRDEFGRDILEPAPKIEIVEIKEEVEREIQETDEETGETVQRVEREMVVVGYARREAIDEDGNLVYEGTRPKLNPDYDPTKQYRSRADRPEWAAVGMLGVLAVYDDGSCQVGGYCKVADGGIATAAEGEYMLVDGKMVKGYRVIARVTDRIIKVVFR